MTASPYAHRPWLASLRLLGAAAHGLPGAAAPRDPRHGGDRRPESSGDVVSRRDADLPGDQGSIRSPRDAARPHRASRKGDRVGIMLPNCPQYIIAAFAILRHGAIVVNINPSYTAREVLTVASDSGIRLLITLDALAPLRPRRARTRRPSSSIIVTSLAEYSAQAAAAAACRRHGDARPTRSPRSHAPDIFRVPIAPDDLAVLQYTGGTTGTPKGAMLTHANIFANVVQTEAFMYRDAEPRRGPLPARHPVLPHLRVHGRHDDRRLGRRAADTPSEVRCGPGAERACATFSPTYFPAVPTVFVSLLNHPKAKEYGLDKVRTFNSGGAPCPVEVIDQWERTFGRTLNEGYGLSETSPVTHSTPQLGRTQAGHDRRAGAAIRTSRSWISKPAITSCRSAKPASCASRGRR